MSGQDGRQAIALQRPTHDDIEAWKVYWKAQSQPWRMEPEIASERQKYLEDRRTIESNMKQGIYPFKDIMLSRADVEWLLATHENGRGPIDWSDASQRERIGLDLRGAYLSLEDLRDLPLACTRGGVMSNELPFLTKEQKTMAAVHMEFANLQGAQLEGANLIGAQLEGANLIGAQLQKAHLGFAQLQKAELWKAQLQGANLREAQLDGIRLDDKTMLSDAKFGSALLVDVRWGEVNLAVLDWTLIQFLGDEHLAHQTKDVDDYRAAVRANRQLAVVLRAQGLNEEADRFAYRAQKLQRVVFRKQGLETDVPFKQRLRKFSSYILSLLLDGLAGYGYRPANTLFCYVLVIGGFTTMYALFGQLQPFPDALVFSFMSFHGRGFFPSISNETNLHNPLVVFAAAEAVIGLLIEVSLIATFTQRFFGK